MKKNKFSEESQDLLSLGTLHEEVEKEKAKKRIVKLPIFLVGIGIIIMIIGFFYTDIEKVIKEYTDKNKTKEIIKKDDSITYLNCSYNKDNTTLGINKKVEIKYEFKNKALKKTSTITTITILDNSYEIGSNNIKVYYDKYNNGLKDISINGVIIRNEVNKKSFKNTILIDFDMLDLKQVPKNEYLIIPNKKDQAYREVKELEGRAGHICKVS